MSSPSTTEDLSSGAADGYEGSETVIDSDSRASGRERERDSIQQGTGPVKVRSVSTGDAANNTATTETLLTVEVTGKGKATALSSANEHLFSNHRTRMDR